MIWNTDPDQASRLAWWMVSMWWGYGAVHATLEQMKLAINADSIEEVERSLWIMTKKWKLFEKDKNKSTWYAVKKKSEKEDQVKLRVQRTIRKQIALWWVERDLVEEYRKDGNAYPRDVPSVHTNKQFMDQVQCTEQTVTKYLTQTDEEHFGYVLRFGGNGSKGNRKGSKSYFVRPDYDPDMIYNLEQRYGEHKPTHQRPGRGKIDTKLVEGTHIDADPIKTNVKQPS
jgi:hypothetical protein